MSQVKNRRENIFIDKPPVEILTIDAVESALDSDGYVKAEDLPVATTETTGMVSVGDGLSIDENGELSVPLADGSDAGIVKAGSGITIANGVISSGAGISVDVLYQGTGAGSGSWVTDIDIPADYTDYKLIFYNYGALDSSRFGGNCLYPPLIGLNQTGYMRAGSNNDIQVKFTALRKMSVMAASSVSDVTVVGIR